MLTCLELYRYLRIFGQGFQSNQASLMSRLLLKIESFSSGLSFFTLIPKPYPWPPLCEASSLQLHKDMRQILNLIQLCLQIPCPNQKCSLCLEGLTLLSFADSRSEASECAEMQSRDLSCWGIRRSRISTVVNRTWNLKESNLESFIRGRSLDEDRPSCSQAWLPSSHVKSLKSQSKTPTVPRIIASESCR